MGPHEPGQFGLPLAPDAAGAPLRRGFQVAASYTWSRSLDSTNDGINFVNTQSTNNQLTSIPASQGGMRLDRGLSDFHRGQRLTLAWLWEAPGPGRGWWKYAFGGWTAGGIASFQSGTPFTVRNGLDRNGDAVPNNDRPDLGNLAAPLASRAVVSARCPAGFQNADTLDCVTPASVRWLQAPVGMLPNGSTVGRNPLLTGGTNNFDLSLSKSFPVGDRTRLELRWEAVNAFNHPQFTGVPERDVLGTPAGRFLNRDFTDSGIRTMWIQVKVIF